MNLKDQIHKSIRQYQYSEDGNVGFLYLFSCLTDVYWLPRRFCRTFGYILYLARFQFFISLHVPIQYIGLIFRSFLQQALWYRFWIMAKYTQCQKLRIVFHVLILSKEQSVCNVPLHKSFIVLLNLPKCPLNLTLSSKASCIHQPTFRMNFTWLIVTVMDMHNFKHVKSYV